MRGMSLEALAALAPIARARSILGAVYGNRRGGNPGDTAAVLAIALVPLAGAAVILAPVGTREGRARLRIMVCYYLLIFQALTFVVFYLFPHRSLDLVFLVSIGTVAYDVAVFIGLRGRMPWTGPLTLMVGSCLCAYLAASVVYRAFEFPALGALLGWEATTARRVLGL